MYWNTITTKNNWTVEGHDTTFGCLELTL